MTIDDQIVALIAEAIKPLKTQIGQLEAELNELREIVSQPPAPAPAPAPPPAPAPAPEPPPAPVQRSRAEVQRILLEEFAKQTSFVPGGSTGSATPAEINDPNRAIQKWIDSLIANHSASTLPENELRALMASMIAVDAKKYEWAKNYPPKSPSGPVISGAANMPK